MQRTLGHTRRAVQAIGLGGMPLSIQGRPDERAAMAVIESYVAAGGDFIDSAISYCLDDEDFGHNERLIAKTLTRLGHADVVVATKGGLKRPNGRWEVDCSPAWLRHCCEQSARDLGAPIALYYLHAVDPAVPFAESLGELVRLRDAGTIAAIGLSNVDARQLDEALGMTPIAAVQNRCNLYERHDLDNGLVARCEQAGVAYVAYAPVGGHFGHRRLGQDPTLSGVAAKHSASPQAIALAWLLAQASHVLAIPGATKVSSIADSLTAPALALDTDDLGTLDALGGAPR